MMFTAIYENLATQWECQQLLHIHVSPDSESYHTLGALKVRIGENEEVSAESTTWMRKSDFRSSVMGIVSTLVSRLGVHAR